MQRECLHLKKIVVFSTLQSNYSTKQAHLAWFDCFHLTFSCSSMFLSCSTSIALQGRQFTRFESFFHSILYTANDGTAVDSVRSRFAKPAVPANKTSKQFSRAYKASGRTIQENPKLFCFGLGYTGEAIAKMLKYKGWTVAGTCRSNTKRQFFSDSDIDAFIFDPEVTGDGLTHEAILALQSSTHLLSTIPPSVIQSYDPFFFCRCSNGISVTLYRPKNLDSAG